MAICRSKRMPGGPVSSLGSLLRARRCWARRFQASWRRRLAANCRIDEYEVLPAHRTRAVDPSGRDGTFHRISSDERSAQEGLLLLAVPRRSLFRAPMDARQKNLWTQFASPQMGGYSLAVAEISASRLLRLCNWHHVRRGNP